MNIGRRKEARGIPAPPRFENPEDLRFIMHPLLKIAAVYILHLPPFSQEGSGKNHYKTTQTRDSEKK